MPGSAPATDGGRGRRVRRHVPQASGRCRDRHQRRSRASRSLQDIRGGAGSVPCIRRERAVLRLRGDVHRPSGGAAPGRADHDRRIITYGENPQADVRLVDLDHVDGRSRFSVVFRDRAGETMHEIRDLALPMPGPAQRAQRHRGDRGRARARDPGRRDPRGAAEFRRRAPALHPHRRMERRSRSSTTTAIIRSRSRRCCAPRANRSRGR